MRIARGLVTSQVVIIVCGSAAVATDRDNRDTSTISAFHGPTTNIERPPIIHRATLRNGLRVVIAPDRTLPVVTVAILYGVGYVDDPPGREGMAHLVEHMMFKGSAGVADGEQYALVSEAGGYTYGGNQSRVSAYSTTLPSNQLELVLALESDRMRNLRMTEVALENQKRAVEAEAGNRERDAFVSAEIAAVMNTPMPGQFERLELSEAQAFYERFYGPNNAVLVITGDVDEISASRLVTRYFSNVPKLREVPKRTQTPRAPEARHRLTHPTRRAIHLAFPVPFEGSKEDDGLAMLVRMAGTGQNARLRERLITKANLASDVSVMLRDSREHRWFIVIAVPAPGRSTKDLEMGVRKELAGLASEPAGPAEFERSLNAGLARHARALLISESRAELLGKAELFGGNAQIIQQQAVAMRETTPADLQRLARKYLLSPPQVTVVVEPNSRDEGNWK